MSAFTFWVDETLKNYRHKVSLFLTRYLNTLAYIAKTARSSVKRQLVKDEHNHLLEIIHERLKNKARLRTY
ncbi:type II toxin-antitoxin system RelB/DinJ family antitoxin [Acetobacter orientalis]|uniref:type II toxin-antitoxin system RelB/DinJ family antitoxin n=1 Tax=Acetobacter orientalis TaxID=146474 RepID=UPI0039EBAC30